MLSRGKSGGAHLPFQPLVALATKQARGQPGLDYMNEILAQGKKIK